MSLPHSDPTDQSASYHLALLRQDIAKLSDDVRVVTHLLTGNGTPEKGVIVRLDRIEQDNQRRENLAKTAIGGAIAASVAALGAWLKG